MINRKVILYKQITKKFAALAVIFITASFIFPVISQAAVFKANDNVQISSSQTINDDVYITAGTAQIEGLINGDLIVAGGNVSVKGKVNGNIIAVGGQVNIDGDVGGTVRVGSGNVSIGGQIKKDLLVGSGTVLISEKAGIGRDLYIGSGTANVAGKVGRNLKGGIGQLSLSGTVGKNVYAEGDQITVTPKAVINGNLTYRSQRKAKIAKGAQIKGKISKLKPRRQPRRNRQMNTFFRVAMWFLSLIWLILVGLVVFILFPNYRKKVTSTLAGQPLQSLGLGLIILIITPIVSLLLFMLILGIPLSLVLISIYGLAIYLTTIYVSFFLGNWILAKLLNREVSWFLSLLLGVLIITLFGAIPCLGAIIRLFVVVFGLGAMSMALYQMYKGPKSST